MAFNLPHVIKALLFSTSQPLSVKDLQTVFTRFHEAANGLPLDETRTPAEMAEAVVAEAPAEPGAVEPEAADPELYHDVPSLVTAAQIREVMDVIAAELAAANEVYLLTETAQGWRLVTRPRFAHWVRLLRNEPPPLRLSPPALETLAVVAYRQPVTRAEIEAIRGVSAEAGINKLLERELILITGRADLPGRPLQYATTENFLTLVGARSLDELPASDVLSSRQIDEWLRVAANPARVGDAAMGLPQEELALGGRAETEVRGQSSEVRAEQPEGRSPEPGEGNRELTAATPMDAPAAVDG
jgi:segregation and condensation protein B